MLRIIFLFALCTGVLAERLTLVDLTDPKSNLLFSQLAQYRGTSQTQAEAIATATAANSILKHLAPSILLLSGYTGLFTGNCSMLFNNQLEGVACDINPASGHDLTAGAEIIPGSGLPAYYANQIRHSNMLLANIFADWTGRKKQEFETDLHFKTETCTNSLTQEPTLTHLIPATETQTASASASASLTATMTWLASLSASPSKTLSPSLPVIPTPTASASHMDTPSVTPSRFATHTASLSSTYSKTLSVLASATRSLTASLSPTRTVTPPPTKTQTKSPTFQCNPPPTGLMAVWNASTGVYADATNQTGRYTIFNGTATDTFTGIQWEQAASNITMDWASAASYCGNRTTGGLTGWRVPNIAELGTMVDYTIGSPYVNTTVFPNATATSLWSASTDIGNSGNSWYLTSGNAQSYFQATGTASSVRCVHSCYPLPESFRYSVGTGASTGIVTDHVTGFIWQKTAPTTGGPNSDGTYTQSGAASYCSGLNLGGFSSGWRLPAVRELQVLVEYSVNYGVLMMDVTAFTGEPADVFWSSTLLVDSSIHAWFVNFANGGLRGNIVTYSQHVRCLR